MRKSRLLIAVSITAILVSLLILHIYGVTGIGTRLGFQRISPVLRSGMFTWSFEMPVPPGCYVINNAEEWANTWGDMSIPSDVDFSRDTVVLAYMGTFPHSGYVIRINEVIDTGLSVVIKVEKTYPGKDSGRYPIEITAYDIVKVDKIGKVILFNTTTKIV